MSTQEKFSYKLLVEGNNDRHVVWALCERHDFPENFDVVDCQSIDRVFSQFRLRLSIPENNQRIGVMVDADVNLEKRWNTFLSLIQATGKYDCGNVKLEKNGVVLAPKDAAYPIVGIWIMPDNNLNGMLEDFVVSLAQPDDILMVKADEVLNALESEGIQRYKSVHRTKAKIHTFLAWQDEPGKPMGQAITAKVLDANSPNAVAFVNWLRKLYGGE